MQILEDLKSMAWFIYNRSGGALGKDLSKIRIILPPDQYQRLIIPITAAGSTSLKTYFEETIKSDGGGVPVLSQQSRLSTAQSYAYNGGPNILQQDTAIILYQDGDQMADPMFVLTQPIEVPAPVRQTGVGDVTYFHARGGGLKLPDARRMKYVIGL